MPSNNVRAAPDKLLVDIADYVLNYKIETRQAIDSARLCLTDSLACGLDALDYPDCTKLMGPIVPGTVVPNGSRVPGTRYEMDPVTATFNLGAAIRWFDFNDTFTCATGIHPSDNLAGTLMLADHLSRQRAAAGRDPILMREVFEDLIKAYEIQGCIALENDFFHSSIDHNLPMRVGSAAVLTRMLGGTHDQIVNAVSNAWIDCSLVLYRYAPNTGSRKSWACANTNAEAMRLAMMAIKGEMGYPSVLTAKNFGFYDARYGGRQFKFQRPFGDYIVQNVMFKFAPGGMHGHTAMECASRLHPLVNDRIDKIERIELHGHRDLIDIMHKTGPLYNPADRDHCVEYLVAVALIQGQVGPRDLEDGFAADPRIDRLRDKMTLTEDPRYSKDFYDPAKRSEANAVQVFFTDGTSTPKIEVEYPLGHKRRRAEAMPALRAKFKSSLERRFTPGRREQILELCESAALEHTPVNKFVDLLVTDLPDQRLNFAP